MGPHTLCAVLAISVFTTACGRDSPPDPPPPSGSPELCDGRDSDVDGIVDEDADCEGALSVASASCIAGECVIEECSAGYADCNGSFDDVCETRTFYSRSDCGGCGNACGATEACLAGACTLVETTYIRGSSSPFDAYIAEGETHMFIGGTFDAEILFGASSYTPVGERSGFVWWLYPDGRGDRLHHFRSSADATITAVAACCDSVVATGTFRYDVTLGTGGPTASHSSDELFVYGAMESDAVVSWLRPPPLTDTRWVGRWLFADERHIIVGGDTASTIHAASLSWTGGRYWETTIVPGGGELDSYDMVVDSGTIYFAGQIDGTLDHAGMRLSSGLGLGDPVVLGVSRQTGDPSISWIRDAENGRATAVGIMDDGSIVTAYSTIDAAIELRSFAGEVLWTVPIGGLDVHKIHTVGSEIMLVGITGSGDVRIGEQRFEAPPNDIFIARLDAFGALLRATHLRSSSSDSIADSLISRDGILWLPVTVREDLFDLVDGAPFDAVIALVRIPIDVL